MTNRGQKISKSILLLLDQTVEAIELSTLPFRVKKFSRHLFSEEQKYTRPQVKRAFVHLQKSGFVQTAPDNKEREIVTLTERGEKKAKANKIEMLVIRKPKHWDAKWRMIVFDIPEGKRKLRDALRHILKKLNFYKLQDSIWIYPYDCRQAIEYLADYYELAGHIHFAIVDVFDQEEEARAFYGIKEHALPYEADHKNIRNFVIPILE